MNNQMDRIRAKIALNEKIPTSDICYLMRCFKEHVEQRTRQINSEEEAQKILDSTLSLFFKEKGTPIRELGSGDGFLDILLILLNKDVLSKVLIELKIYYSPSYFEKGFKRLQDYMKSERLNNSFYVVFYTGKRELKDQTKKFGKRKVYTYFIRVQNKFEARLQRLIRMKSSEWIEHDKNPFCLASVPDLMEWFNNKESLKLNEAEQLFVVTSSIKHSFGYLSSGINLPLCWLEFFNISLKQCVSEIEKQIEEINPYGQLHYSGEIENIFNFLHSLKRFCPKTYHSLMKAKIRNGKKFSKKIQIYLSEGDIDFEYQRRVFDVMRNMSSFRFISRLNNLGLINVRDERCKLLWKIFNDKKASLSRAEEELLPSSVKLFYYESGDALLKTIDSENLAEKLITFLVNKQYFEKVLKNSPSYIGFLLLYSKNDYSKSFSYLDALLKDKTDHGLWRIIYSLNLKSKRLEKYVLTNLSKMENPELAYHFATHFYHNCKYREAMLLVNQALKNLEKFEYDFSIAYAYRLKSEILFIFGQKKEAEKIVSLMKRKKWNEYLPNFERIELRKSSKQSKVLNHRK